MARITEKELILPALYLLNKQSDRRLSTTELINQLRNLLKPDEEDLRIIEGRSDDYFSQKVRNLKSHGTLQVNGLCSYDNGIFKLEDVGYDYLEQNQYLLNAILPLESYYVEFTNSISNIKALCEINEINGSLAKHYFGMLYSSTITSLETYLYDALRYKLDNEQYYLEKFVKNFNDYQKEKIKICDIYDEYSNLELKVKKSLTDLIYHRLGSVKKIYKNVFDISFLDIGALIKSVSIRHDLVHRNGKTNDGNYHNITKDEVLCLCLKVSSFVENIENQFQSLAIAEEDE